MLPIVQQAEISEALPICFRLGSARTEHLQSVITHRLSAHHADATAQLLPVMLCGEESAALVFDALQDHTAPLSVRLPSVQFKLRSIARDEHRHELLLRQLRAALPPQEIEPHLRRELQRFFLRMADCDVTTHLTRIVALDSAVCALLGALRARTRPLGRDQAIASLLTHIHGDEARHVQIARDVVDELSTHKRTASVAIEVREGLVDILSHRAAALDCLQVDPDKMFARLRCLPRGLFA